MTILIKKNESTTTLRRITVIIVDQSDGNTLETGQTNFNIEVSKAGGTQASGTGVWGEVGEGEYYYQFGTTEVNTFGKLTARFQKTGMREFKGEAQVVGFNPYQTLPTQSEVNDLQSDINDIKGTGFVKANHSLVKTQSNINALNDPTSSAINAVITTAHGAGTYTPATGFTTQTDINTHESNMQSYINAKHGDTQSLINNLDVDINALNDLSQTQVNAQVDTALSDIRLDELISQSINNIKPAKESFVDLILNSNTDQNFLQSTDSLEAIRNNQSAGGGATPTSIWNFSPRVLTANTNLNDPTPSVINAVITTAHGAGAYNTSGGASTTDINSIVNAQGLEVQSLINALNDLSTSQVQSIVNAEGNEVQSLINALNDLSQTQVNAQVDIALSDIRLDELISQSTANIDATKNAFLDLIMNKGVSQLFNQATDSLEAIRDNQSAGGGATPTSIWNFGTRVLTANTNLNDPTPSVINAVITTAHGAGSYVGAGASQTILNEHNATQSMINALNDITSSAVNAVITTAHGAGSYVGAGASQTIINEHNATQSLINALNDLSTSQVQSIVNAEGNETQSLINALNDLSTSQVQSIVNGLDDITTSQVQSIINALNDLSTSQVQSIVNAEGLEVQSLINNLDADVQALNNISTSEVQSIVNAQGLEVQSLINAMDVKIIRIEGRGGRYLVGKYTYNTSDINTKIEYWQYGSQTDMNNHQTINNVNKWQLDATLTGQLTDVIKAGDHA